MIGPRGHQDDLGSARVCTAQGSGGYPIYGPRTSRAQWIMPWGNLLAEQTKLGVRKKLQGSHLDSRKVGPPPPFNTLPNAREQ